MTPESETCGGVGEIPTDPAMAWSGAVQWLTFVPCPDCDGTDPALTAWNTNQDRGRAEYALNPATRGSGVHGPCLAGCGRPTRSHTGLCRTCTTATSDPTKENRP